jgi:hypothetical protein
MNVRLQYDMTWRAGIWFQHTLQMNNYQIELIMTTNTSDANDQIVCMDRINHFIYDELGSTVFIDENDTEQIQLLAAAGVKLTTLPETPIDQVIGWVVFLKLNAILEDRMIISDIKIQSDLGDNIKYMHSIGESLGPVESTGWWTDPSPKHSSVKPGSNKKRIVKLNNGVSWKKLDMNWSNELDTKHTANTVVFAQFAPTQEDE